MTVFLAILCNILVNLAIGLLVANFLGPEQYGRFALAYATGIAVQTAFFDWIRLGATRFYSERIRTEEPALRATLDCGIAVIATLLVAGASLLMLTGVSFTLSNGLIALALGIAITNGLFDYYMALVRARFHDGLFTRLVLVKNVMALVLMGAGAFWFGSANITLVGGIVSFAGSVVTARAALRDPGSSLGLARVAIAGALMAYSLPIVVANLLYLAIPLANRSVLAIFHGFSETGQFSLAYDFGTKAIQAIGSALDIVLLQIAIAMHELRGPAEGRQQVARNMTIVIAMVLPACTGLWLTLPSLAYLIVPSAYLGHFGELLPLMMTGLFCMAIIHYALYPIFQISKKTVPLVVAALAACVADVLLIVFLPGSDGASRLAIAQAGAMVVALVVLVGFATAAKPQWPRVRDLLVIVVANAVMTALVLPLRDNAPSLTTLALQAGTGALIYAAMVLGFDVAGLRGLTVARLRLALARTRPL
jgi:O-antigen/teichoic acid export membrane protein